ncbi:Zinc/iron permease [Gongronella butleri]|nr:Zinc/iron permease [Gongronella butleri]
MKSICLLIAAASLTLVRAQDASAGNDACQAESLSDYNLGLRVGAIFILAGTSSIGVFFPMIMHRIAPYSEGGYRDWVLTIARFFGTGVILATAFVHMLPDAFNNFQSPCLTEGWLSYGAFAGVFCMIASFSLQLLELASIAQLKKINTGSGHEEEGRVNGNGVVCEPESAGQSTIEKHDHTHHTQGMSLLEEDNFRHVGTLMLELGIVMHSVLIGLDLGTTANDTFITLLIALVFHQFFEGLALGTRIIELKNTSMLKMIGMGLLFVLTTPLGVAIGIGIRSSYNGNSYSAVLSSAILDSMSAGILLYNAYVSLMSVEINHSTQFHAKSAKRKIICFISMYIGAGLMSLIGEWA